MRKHAAIHADEKQLWADALRGSIAHVKLPFLELVRCKAAVCAEAVGVLDEAALPCARRSCDEAWCAGANLMSSSFLAGQRSAGMLKEPKVGIDACAQRFCAQAFDVCDSGNGTCPQVRMSKADVVIDIRSVVCVCACVCLPIDRSYPESW